MGGIETKKRPFLVTCLPGALLLTIIWAIFIVDSATELHLYKLGIYPRTLWGLVGVLVSPLVHGDIRHILSNSIPVFVLTTGLFYFYRKIAASTFIWLWLSTGFWVWCMARPSFHIGASGLVYALAFFLFFMGLFRWERWSMAVALTVAFLYGGLLYGLAPEDPKISWESHMLGGLAGFLLSLAYIKKDLGVPIDPPSWKKRKGDDLPLPFEGPYWMADENGIIPEHLMPETETEKENLENEKPVRVVHYKYHYLPKEDSSDKNLQ